MSEQRVTYAHTLKIRDKKTFITFLDPLWNEQEIVNHYAQYDQFGSGSDIVVVFYDPEKLKRASEVEYWFEGDPRDAVILIFSKRSLVRLDEM